MDSRRFDRFTRALSTRRTALGGLLGGGLLAALGVASAADDASAAPACPRGKKRCKNKCIPKRKCCTNGQCRPKGSGKVCRRGRCLCPPGKKLCGVTCVATSACCCAAGQLCFGGACWPDAEEIALVSLINTHRVANGAAPLTLQNQLGAAAELHSQDQAANNFSGHPGSDGSSPTDRLLRAGYNFSAFGENIYFGGGTANDAFTWWRNSPGHNGNMIYPIFTQLGIGRAKSSAGVWYWTATFGSP